MKNAANTTSRREFLKTSAGLTAAAATLNLGRSAWAAGGDTIKIGMIGCGGRCTGAAMDALDADPGVKLVAMAEIFSDKLESSLTKIKAHCPDRTQVDAAHKFTGFDGYKHVIESSDVVLIACSSKFHPKYMRAAIDAGKHVFVEKPHGIDPVGVRATQEAADLARTKNLCVLSGLHNRYNPGVIETMKRIHDGAIGNIVSMEVNFLRAPYVLVERQPGWSEIEYQFRNWYHFTWLAGDDVTQSLVHSVDKACWVMHEETPLKAHGLAGRSASFGTIYGDAFDHHSVVYEYANGVKMYALCRTQKNCYGGVSDYVYGTKGRASLLNYKIQGETNWDYPGPFPSPYKEEHKALFAAIRSGKPINSGSYMANSTMVAVLGQIVCYTGNQLGWKKAISADFAFEPRDCDFKTEPPVKPGPDGNYPIAVPGVTRLIKGT
ncbi:MAG: Gfo/Idh/MocA family oxidoreductase [Kiritimatiellae bacterium]|nr:Gfo/Idh/MocA family oxidoreductase [Kiritimatiellia bacterium]MDD5523386.1 Gfo/Idh/MocA family oxidoreductase [Kiritimatiellia bacterium]